MRTVVVTGFEPFGGDERNPSREIARTLDGRILAGRRVAGAVLPCEFGESRRQLRELVRTHRPELVVAVGLAATRREITPERIAINVDDARIADNARRQPVDAPIVSRGPAAYWSTLPVKAIVAALQRRRINAAVSQTAGTFVCNHVFYGLMHDLRRARGVRGGFIHVPWPSDWPGHEGAMPFEQMIVAMEVAVRVSLRRRVDLRRRGGAES